MNNFRMLEGSVDNPWVVPDLYTGLFFDNMLKIVC